MNDETTRDYGYLALVTDAYGGLVHSEVLGSDVDLKMAEEDILATVRMIPHLPANGRYAVEFRWIGDPVDRVKRNPHPAAEDASLCERGEGSKQRLANLSPSFRQAVAVTVDMLLNVTDEGDAADLVTALLTERMEKYTPGSELLDWRYADSGYRDFSTVTLPREYEPETSWPTPGDESCGKDRYGNVAS